MTTAEKVKTTKLSPERQALADAINAVEDAQADAKHAENLLSNANRMLAELLAKWEKHASLDDEISHARAAATVSAIEKGNRPPTDEPQGFASRKIARDEAEGQLASVRNAIPLLEKQLEDAKQKIDVRQYEVDLAAEAVFVAEAESITARYIAQLRECREMLYALRYYGIRQVKRDPLAPKPAPTPMVYNPNSSPTRQIAMPQYVLEACGEDCLGASEMKGGLRVRDLVSAAVSQHWLRLHSDPTSELEIGQLPPPFDPSAMERACEEAGIRTSKSYEPGSMS